jgi:hypothetical protein
VTSGTDDNRNGVLDSYEVDFTNYVCGAPVGALVTELLGNGSAPTSTGYYNMITSYTPSQNVVAFVYARCSIASYTAGEFGFRAAYRVGTYVTIGDAFYLFTYVQNDQKDDNSVFDYFNLNAGTTYDFGMDFYNLPSGAWGECSQLVQIFSR